VHPPTHFSVGDGIVLGDFQGWRGRGGSGKWSDMINYWVNRSMYGGRKRCQPVWPGWHLTCLAGLLAPARAWKGRGCFWHLGISSESISKAMFNAGMDGVEDNPCYGVFYLQDAGPWG